MNFLNYIIQLPNQEWKSFREKGVNKSISLASVFFNDVEDIFKKLFSEDEVVKMNAHSQKSNFSMDNIFEMIVDLKKDEEKVEEKISSEEEKKKKKYEEKVKEYTSYLIGRKLSENVSIFKKDSILSGNLKL